MLSLEKIKVKGYRSIRELDLKLRPLNVLIGPNGAGKSNLLGVFKLMGEIFREKLQDYSGRYKVNELLYLGRKITSAIDITFDLKQFSYQCKLSPTNYESLMFSDERGIINSNGEVIKFGKGHKESQLFLNVWPFMGKGQEGTKQISLFTKFSLLFQKLRVYHLNDTSEGSKFFQKNLIDDYMYLREDGGNFASYLSFLKKSYPDHYRIMLYTIRDVVPSFNDFVFNTEPKGSDIFKLLWEHKGSDISFNLNSLSEGSIRFIFYALLLNQPEEKLPSIIIIDEPELGLHPYAIHVLAGMLKSVSTKRQVIVSTQSTTFLNQFSPEDVIVTDRKDNESIFRRLSKKELKKWVGEYSLGELWEMNVLGGRP